MKFKSFPPSPSLSHVIAYFWTAESSSELEKGCLYRLIPDGYVDWIFHLKTPWAIRLAASNSAYQQSQAHLFNQLKQYVEVRLPQDDMLLLGVKFHPWSAQQIWNLNMTDLRDTIIGLENIQDPFFSILKDKIENEPVLHKKISLIEAAVTTKLSNYQSNALESVIAHLIDHPAQAKLPSFANSQRRLEQRFKEEIGLSPKLFHRIIRVNKTIKRMMQSTKPHLTSISYEMGYFDQSHFIYDFKKFTGLTPSVFLKQSNRDGDLFNLEVEKSIS